MNEQEKPTNQLLDRDTSLWLAERRGLGEGEEGKGAKYMLMEED